MSTGTLDIDFAWQRRRPARWAGAMLLLIAASLAGWVAWNYAELHAETSELSTQKARLERRQSAIRPGGPVAGSESLKLEVQSANRIIGELDRPWHSILGAVESAASEHATLLSVEPEPEREELRLQGEARDLNAMLEFVRQLGQQPAVRNAHLAGHQVNLQDAQRPVRFTVLAGWATAVRAQLAPASAGALQ